MHALRFALCLPIPQLNLFCGPLFSNTSRGWWFKIVMRISRRVFKKQNMALPCSVAFVVFCASHARRRCNFHSFRVFLLHRFLDRVFFRFSFDFSTLFRSKIEKKSKPKAMKKSNDFLIDFFTDFGRYSYQ